MAIVDISGAYDLHIHANPSLFPRIGDDLDLGRHAEQAGLSGIVLKNHFESTVGRAASANKIIDGTLIFGGLVLNGFAGGLNPIAVEHALKLGAKEIWLPTIDSLAHSKVFGHLGGVGYQESGTQVPRKGITILYRGQLKEEAKTIVELVRDYEGILGTGHLGKKEIVALTRFVREIKCTRLLITHPFFNPPNFTVAEVAELASLGAHFELCGGNLYPIPGIGRIDTYRETVAQVKPEHLVLSSDAGQPRKSLPAEVLRVFAQCLMDKGVAQGEIETMIKDNPARLLGV